MFKKIVALVPGIIYFLFIYGGSTLVSDIALAAGPFYEGKTIRLIAGALPGGGYDLYARAYARHMGKHIPGNPPIIVENMTGAGSMIAANYLYKAVKPDGLTFSIFVGDLFLNQLLGQEGIDFDARKFEYIGTASSDYNMVVLTKASGIKNIDGWMASKAPVKLASSAAGTSFDNAIRIMKESLGLPIRIVSGYKGSPEMRLAAEGGEVDGFCLGYTPLKATLLKSVEKGDFVVVLQISPKPFPEFSNIPLAIKIAKTDEARKMIDFGIHSPSFFSRPFVLPPGTPKDRVQILRTALIETLKDKEFLADMEKSKLGLLNPASGEELEKAVNELFKLDPKIIAMLKDILFK